MGQLTYGLGSKNLNFDLPDILLRNIQAAMMDALGKNKSFFLRSNGTSGEKSSNITITINPASQLAFFYDGLEIPERDEEVMSEFVAIIDEFGGLALDTLFKPVPQEESVEASEQ